MSAINTYVQQLSFDGSEYTKGTVVDLLSEFNIVCQDFPFKKFPEPKELPTRDWAGVDGVDVYVPQTIPLKHYELEAVFLCKGTEETIREDINDFIEFLYGRNQDAVGGRLAIYNEHTGIGRKDVVVSKVDNDLFFVEDSDCDAVARFKVKFFVYDPTTDVTPTSTTSNGITVINDLSFSTNE